MMKTKFGKLDNLEKIEQVMINPKIEELTFKMLDLQDNLYLEQSEWEVSIITVCFIHFCNLVAENKNWIPKIFQIYF